MARTSAGVSRDKLPADVHAALVETLFGTFGSFLSGMIGGLLVPVIAWVRSDEPIFAICTGVLLTIGLFRLCMFRIHAQTTHEARAAKAARWEMIYAVAAVGYMTAIGVTAAIMFHKHFDESCQ